MRVEALRRWERRVGRPWALSVAEHRAVLIALDLLAVNAALLGALAWRPAGRAGFETLLQHPHWFGLWSLLYELWAWALDAYAPRALRRFADSVRTAVLAGLAAAGCYLLIPYLTPPLPSSRSPLFAFLLLSAASLLAARGLYTLLLAPSAPPRRVLIVGAGWAGRTIAEALAQEGRSLYTVLGFLDDDPTKQGTTVGGWSVLGDRHALPDVIRRHHVDTVVAAITWNPDAEWVRILMDALEQGVEVIPMSVLYEQLTGRVPVEHVGDDWHVALPIQHPLTRPLNRALKRAFDVVAATLGLLVLAPFVPLIALAIYLDSPGPIFYTQERVGRGGRIFKVYKFRTMIPNAEQGQAVWAQENDPRVTRVGRLLRKTHIDEFPQFLNILKGEMSAVGPRPERPEFVEELAREIPFYRVRHAVKPGMAGWALVRYGYAASKEDALLRLQYDLYYIKHWSLWLDLVILLKTVLDAITLRGR
ncbi:MAG: sugar transferase [Thermoleophilia bacterium]